MHGPHFFSWEFTYKGNKTFILKQQKTFSLFLISDDTQSILLICSTVPLPENRFAFVPRTSRA